MRIYTRTGDMGETGLIGGERVSKNSLRIHAIGEVDELNSSIGLARVYSQAHALEEPLSHIQNLLFDLGSELASPPGRSVGYVAVTEDHVAYLERSIDSMTANLPPLAYFILPGGTPLAAHLHVARAICRRVERAVYALDEADAVGEDAKRFLNRLSDWLFTAARTANASQNVEDVPWHRTGSL